jgi:hypothetical protein
MITGLYQLWQSLYNDNETNLSFSKWKYIYFKKLNRRKAGYKIKKPRRKGLQKWM